MKVLRPHRLSQLDAFFVAYQERADISMQLGIEVELDREASLARARAALADLVSRWPRLGSTLEKTPLGLRWGSAARPDAMLATEPSIERWRNQRIDPFREHPFQLLVTGRWLAFRAHHAVCDGESFAALCAIAVATVTGAERPEGRRATDEVSPFAAARSSARKKLPAMIRYARWLMRESKADSSMRLSLDALEPGDVDIAQVRLPRERVEQLARSAGASPALTVCAAWIRAIGTESRARGSSDDRAVSIEMPVSARRQEIAVGNFISPLLLFGDSTQSTAAIAGQLRKQFRRAVADRAHLAVPMLTAPGKYLPWWLFRRVGANTAFSGFASSHFGWLDGATDIRDAVAAHSDFRVTDLRVYTPVCLHMGAALSVIPWPDELQLTLTYRRSALGDSRAADLLAAVCKALS